MSSKAFPVECIEDIFRHLNQRNWLKCSVVCPSWNEFIGSTKSCVKNIVFKCSNIKRHQVSFKRILETSNRKYELVTFREVGNYSEEIHKALSAKGRQWTFVNITEPLEFSTVNTFLNFLRIFQSSAEALILHKASLTENFEPDFNATDFQFP